MMVALGACTQLLDLEAANVVSDLADEDGDGIADSLDNCPHVANPDQLDTDHDRRGDACDSCPFTPPTRDRDNDGIDDACDSCILGPNVDDDGDGIMDACDLCPATQDTMQPDDDGDLIGNNCDSDRAGDNVRALFDPFTHIDPSWEGGADWQLAADGSSLIPSPTGLSTLRHDNGTDWVSTASAMFEVASTGVVGVALADAGLRCELRCTAGECVLHAEDLDFADSDPFTIDRGTVKASLVAGGMLAPRLICEVYQLGPPSISVEAAAAVRGGDHTSVFASPGNKALGADLVR